MSKMKPTEVQTFKIQRSMSTLTNHSKPQMLIYNQDRSIHQQDDLFKVIADFMGADLKVYVRGFVDEDGVLQIVDRLKDQDW